MRWENITDTKIQQFKLMSDNELLTAQGQYHSLFLVMKNQPHNLPAWRTHIQAITQELDLRGLL